MTNNMADLLATLSPEELRAFHQQVGAVLKDADTIRREEYGVLGAEFFAHVIASSPLKKSETSAWAGYSERSVPLTHEGRRYTISFSIRDEATSDARVEGVDYKPKKKDKKEEQKES